MEKGYIHIYTGDGKGKTTAAFGLAVRALCAGLNVAIGQFVKSMKYHETRLADLLVADVDGSRGGLVIRQLGRGCIFGRTPAEEDIAAARKGLGLCRKWLQSGDFDVVVLDEITVAISLGLLTVSEVREALDARNPGTEVVLTGRAAPQELIELADLVTEMREVKHYYRRGVLSRSGIDN